MTRTHRGPARLRLRGWGWRHAGRSAWALRGVDLDVEPGERVLLLAPSGGGKSTLLHAVAGLLDADTGDSEGDIAVDGLDPHAARERTALVLQDPESQIVMARCGDDVAFGLENAAVPAPSIWPSVDSALRTVGFPYDRSHSTSALSGGEQQRLVLAGSLAIRPGLLLLDEPTANLDPEGSRLIAAALTAMLEARTMTLVLVEHRIAAALHLVDRVVVLEPGAGVLADGTAEQVFATHGQDLAARGVWVPGGVERALAAAPTRTARRGARSPAGAALSAGSGPTVAGVTGPVGAPRSVGADLLVAESVSFRRPGSASDAVVDASITLRAGAATAVIGPNGSGKSSLALLLAGLTAPRAGVVRATAALAGAHATTPPIRWPADRLARRIGTVFQDPEHQFLARTVLDELTLGPLRTGATTADARRRADDLMMRLHLDRLAAANPFTLSGGEKRRLSVATALACRAPVLVLDEPTFGQDLRTWLELLSLLAALRDDGSAVCAVSHDIEFVAALADDVVRMEAGCTLVERVGAAEHHPQPPARAPAVSMEGVRKAAGASPSP